MEDIEKYASCMPNGGLLFLSGFLTEDVDVIKGECVKHGLTFESTKNRNNWISAKFVKTR